MNHVAVIYWSGTGNTEAMAKAVLRGAQKAGASAELFAVSEFAPEKAAQYDAFAFGCPAMGGESLEDSEFEPLFESVKPDVAGKKAALFGSYGWGDGEWMRSWEDNCAESGITLCTESVICCEAPDDEALSACQALGAALA